MNKHKLNNLPSKLISEIDNVINIKADVKTMKMAIELMDLTSLGYDDNESSIKEICSKAYNKYGKVAAICVYKNFIKDVIKETKHDIGIATVISFPEGKDDIEKIINDTSSAINDGANEIDIVFNWKDFLYGGEQGIEKARNALILCNSVCKGGAKMKVILESGKFNDYNILKEASILSLNSGADFLKTSTGKAENTCGASPEAASIFLEAIKETKSHSGIKLSGGIKTPSQACAYIKLAQNMMGNKWVNKDNFRIGASGLLDVLIQSILDLESQTGN